MRVAPKIPIVFKKLTFDTWSIRSLKLEWAARNRPGLSPGEALIAYGGVYKRMNS